MKETFIANIIKENLIKQITLILKLVPTQGYIKSDLLYRGRHYKYEQRKH